MPRLDTRLPSGAALALFLSGCAVSFGGDTPTPQATQPAPTPTAAPYTQPAPTPTPTPSPTPTPPRPTRPQRTPTDTPPPATDPPPRDPPPTYTLGAPVDIKYDQWGIPHIYGETLPDVLFAQGYAGARDRLWQMDLFRRLAWGRSAEILGESAFDDDLFTRTLKLGAVAKQIAVTLPSSDPEAWEWLVAYSAGVTAYIEDAEAGRNGASFSPQIEAYGYVPEPWYPEDCLAIDKLQTYSLSSDHTTELELSLAKDFVLSEEQYLDLFRPAPLEATAIVPGWFGPEAAAGMRAARPANYEETLAALRAQRAALPQVDRAQVIGAIHQLESLRLPWEGSNNWVMSGAHTRSGFPIIAGDTHEGVDAPPTYWQVHLSAADGSIESAGFSFAGVPFVAFGHNDVVAWAPTTNFVDVTDLFLENYNRRNNTVESFGNPVPVIDEVQVFDVRRSGEPVGVNDRIEMTLQTVPHHGPVLPPELLNGVPLFVSAAWTGLQPRHSLRFLWKINTMRSFEDLREAQQGFLAGAVNMVFADLEGNIGYSARVDVPVRRQIDALNPPYLMLPGEGDYDWTNEVLPDDAIPWAYNPASGFVATANNDPAGGTFDNDPTNDETYLAGAYDSGARAWRIDAVLSDAVRTGRKMTMADHAALQTDDYSRVAARTLPYLLDAAARRPDLVTPELAEALEVLAGWDYVCDADEAAPVLFHAWFPRAMQAMFGDDIGQEIFDDLSGTFVHVLVRPFVYYLDITQEILPSLDAPSADAFPSPSGRNYFDDIRTAEWETRDMMLLGALQRALTEVETTWGPLEGWRWGSLHWLIFNDPAGDLMSDATVGPYEIDGGLFTVDVADFRFTRGGVLALPFDVGNAPSQRFILELDPSGIRAMDVNAGGQSERPGDPHFFDQVELYTRDEYRDLPFYPSEVEASLDWDEQLPAGFPAQR